jgi:glycosyltransferase involved in cell wall biosynthesis
VRVAVNVTWLAPGRVGGSEEYLTRQLLGVDPSLFDVELYCDADFAEAHAGLAGRFHVNPMPRWGASRAARISLEHSWLAVRSRGADVVHHGGGTRPLVGSEPTVLTIHDLQYRHVPEYFGGARRRYLGAMMPRSARGATVIAVPSQFVRSDVIEAFDIPEDRVVVVPHGVPRTARPSAQTISEARARWGVPDLPFVLYPAITHPHKGHAVLVEMLDHLADDTRVVLIGAAGASERAVAAKIAGSPHADRVHRLGRIPGEDRDALLAGADALVFPSEFEGFGAPVVEAMDLGTPVVCSAADALVEVVGDAGVVVAEQTGAAWASGVSAARRAHDELIERGRRRREQFTIESSGAALMGAYRSAVT